MAKTRPKYINAEALKTALVDKFKSRIGAAYVPSWNDAMNVVNSIPAADVVEVMHGRWIKDSEDGPVYCSECGEEHEWEDYRATYCDACGAKMDGGQDE